MTVKRVSDMNYSDIAPCKECLFFSRQSGWMEITWTRVEGPVPMRLWAEFRMSSYVFREAEVGVYYSAYVHWRICCEQEKAQNYLHLSFTFGGYASRFLNYKIRNECKCCLTPDSVVSPVSVFNDFTAYD